MSTPPLRILIADDEPIARRGIRRMLAAFPEAEVIGECKHGQEAVTAIRSQQPDLVFLDIQMPALNGFEVVAQVGVEQMPLTIFVTAYDQYALKAFEAHALDYVLKPIDKTRLHEAYARATRYIQREKQADLQERLHHLLHHWNPTETAPHPKPVERIVIKDGGRIFFLATEDITWVEAAGNYVQIHAAGHKYLLRETMQGMAEKLDPKQFVRISRSVLVNLQAVKEFWTRSKGSYTLVLANGQTLVSSRHYRANLDAIFEA